MADAKRENGAADHAGECCANCLFFFSPASLCCQGRPTAMMVGMQPVPGVIQQPGRPPQVMPKIDSFFPQTQPKLWCGDYARGVHPSVRAAMEGIGKPPILDADQVATLASLETEGTA